MSANAILMETLLRIEHKMDEILKQQKTDENTNFTKMASVNHRCPICDQSVQYQVDVMNSVVVRKCGCSTGKIALDMGAFAPPVQPARKSDNERDTEQEDGIDSNRGNGNRRR